MTKLVIVMPSGRRIEVTGAALGVRLWERDGAYVGEPRPPASMAGFSLSENQFGGLEVEAIPAGN